MIPKTHLEAACCDLVAEVVRKGGTANLKVTGCSMLPAIRPRDTITIKRHNCNELGPGQVILYSRNNRLTAHRIVAISAGSVLTQGDSLSTVDLPVQSRDVIGRVVSIQRNGRTLSSKQTFVQAVAAFLIRRSDLCRRLYLRLSIKLEQFELLESNFEY